MSSQKKFTGIIYRLGKLKILHRIVDKTGVYHFANAILARWPWKKRLPRSGAVIRVGSVAGFALAEEMFHGAGYHLALKNYQPQSFADLGCNVGWFPCFLLEARADSGILGLLIDADPDIVEEAKWHLKENKLSNCEAIVGAVGCVTDAPEILFHINPANTQSSIKPFGENHPFPVKGKIREIRVPVLELSAEWSKRHGSRVIDLLKIDIEGAELEFLRNEIDFIKAAVRRIVCEWHGWHVTLAEIEFFLEEHGFALEDVAEQNELAGVAIFSNTSGSVEFAM
jgi:FkbM family methyltransferase